MDTATRQPELQLLLGELNQLLWRQRTVMTEFVYRLEVQQLLLANGRERWINQSVEELDRSVEQVERYERMQRNLLEEIGRHLPVDGDSSLSDLCAVVSEPWDYIVDEHRSAFLVLIAEAEAASRENHGMARRGLGNVVDLMDRLGQPGGADVPSPQAYGPTAGRGPRRPAGAMLLDREV